MTTSEFRFDDGAAYERYMGIWSQAAGERFLDWLAAQPGWSWLDVGCGNGAFTELVTRRLAPRAIAGIDRSQAQIAYARSRPALRQADLRPGDALALPYAANTFDAAVMPLVIFFLPDPTLGVAEMTRVVRPGGSVSAYAWDMAGGGFPYEPLFAEMRALDLTVPMPPSPEASRLDGLQQLWTAAGLTHVDTTTIEVSRTFADRDDYWATVTGSASVGTQLAALPPDHAAHLRDRLWGRLQPDSAGRITCSGQAHAIRGRVAR
ncbi:MAG: class I SAM-dependent methyltransferase [Acidobacteriota bacterium]